ncbi:MAG TPA: MarR family transcriptional regulator [Candidatus Faecousia faecavium]|nr:MarR family transcriptional regulator [Candidatus Faecousia faecavium]
MQDNGNQKLRLLALMPLIHKTFLSVPLLKEFGYTKTQLFICMALYRRGNLTMSQIAQHISSSKEQATRAVAPLVEDGLVQRFISEENRTHIHVQLTEKGQQLVHSRLDSFGDAFDRKLTQSLTPEEREQLYDSIETAIRLLEKLN